MRPGLSDRTAPSEPQLIASPLRAPVLKPMRSVFSKPLGRLDFLGMVLIPLGRGYTRYSSIPAVPPKQRNGPQVAAPFTGGAAGEPIDIHLHVYTPRNTSGFLSTYRSWYPKTTVIISRVRFFFGWRAALLNPIPPTSAAVCDLWPTLHRSKHPPPPPPHTLRSLHH